jgi:FkbM family methyltransferase
MRIICTILLGPGSEVFVPDAIRSLNPIADEFLLIESGGGGAALRAAYETVEKLATTAHYTWAGDYGAARQFALDKVREMGGDYALTLDPDERVEIAPDFRAQLEAYPQVQVWILADRDTGYWKERIIRANAPVYWHGRVCEFVAGREVAGSRLQGHFWELPKDGGAERRRWERGVVECKRMIDDGDDCFRWRRHMGTCLMGLGRPSDALEQYEAALPLAAHADETAWMRYLICEQYVLAGRLAEARALAATGLADHSGFIPEFGWILAYTDMKADRMQNASRWSQLVLNTPPDKTRIGFRGQNAKRGARQILEMLHTAEQAEWADVCGVRVPLKGLSPKMCEVMKGGRYERAESGVLREVLKPTDRVLELGAGIGFLSTLCCKVLGDSSRVMAVEADPRMEESIRATYAANGVQPTLLMAAVSSDDVPMAIDRREDFWSTRTYLVPRDDSEMVAGVGLGTLLERHAPTVIVCDIEGAEVALTLTKDLPGVRSVLIETHSDGADTLVEQWLTPQGFTRRDIEQSVRLYERTIP